MIHEQMMRLALDEAARSVDDVPVGAVVVKDDAVIASAHNERETAGSPLAHAELLALERAAKALNTRRLAGCTLYVTLEPCPMCAGAIIFSGIDLCVFGAHDTKYGCCGSVYALPADPAFDHNVAIVGGVLDRECAALLQAFFSERRR